MPGEPPTRLKLAQESYLEVLDATKHQDDKIGRLLTAIAFLTGGALVFANRVILDVRYDVDGRDLPLPGVAFGAFLLLVAFSVMELVLSLTTPLTLPGRGGRAPDRSGPGERHRRRSHLYFKAIADETESTWADMWYKEQESTWADMWYKQQDLPGLIEREYVSETLHIAARADQKNTRLTFAATLTLAAMLFFGLAVMLSVDVLVSPLGPSGVETQTVDIDAQTRSTTTTPEKPESLSWTPLRRALVGGTLGIFSLILILQYRRRGQDFSDMIKRRVRKQLPSRHGPVLAALAVSYPSFVASTVLGTGEGWDWDCLVWATGIASLVLVAFLAFSLTKTAASGILTATAIVAIGFWLAVEVISGSGGERRLAVAVAAVVLLLLPAPVQAILTTHRRLRQAALAEQDLARAKPVVGGPKPETVPPPH